MLAVHYGIGLVSGVIIALAIGWAQDLALGTMLAVYNGITIVSDVITALAFSRARIVVLGTMLAVYNGITIVSDVITASVFSRARIAVLGTCWLYEHAKVTTHIRIAARGTFLRHARAEAIILKQ
jgi:hypothetical protein